MPRGDYQVSLDVLQKVAVQAAQGSAVEFAINKKEKVIGYLTVTAGGLRWRKKHAQGKGALKKWEEVQEFFE